VGRLEETQKSQIMLAKEVKRLLTCIVRGVMLPPQGRLIGPAGENFVDVATGLAWLEVS